VTVYGYTVTVYGSLTLRFTGSRFPVFLEYLSIVDFNMLSHRYRYSLMIPILLGLPSPSPSQLIL
jgi:hypothetical protein